MGQLVDHNLPLASGHLLNRPAGTRLNGPAATEIGLSNILRWRNDLSATGEIRARNDFKNLCIAQRGPLNQRNCRLGHLVDIMRGNLGCHSHSNSRCTVQ